METAVTGAFAQMAQRATKFAKKTSRHVEVGVLARTPADPSGDMRAVPLDVLPLLTPFRKRGRISVRIEKLPIQARLSAGRNNGDHSYSLTLDELDELDYIAPEGTDPRPVLALRVISLDDGDAATIALRDLPVEFGQADYGDGVDAADVRRLIDELTRVKSDLAIRESELAEARMKAGAARGEVSRSSAAEEIAAARAAWNVEMDERLAQVRAEAAARLADSWHAWQAEQKEKAKVEPDEIAKERERWQREADAALAKAEKDWRAGESARLTAAEAKWREHAEAAAEKARASSKAMRDHGDAIELRRLRGELLAMQNLLAERDAELAEAQSSKGKPPATNGRDVEAAVAKAEKEWKAADAARLSAAQSKWQEQANKTLAEARDEAKSAREKIDSEFHRLRDELSAAQAKLANREKELAQAHSHVKSGRDQGDAELRRLRDELGAVQSKLSDREKELAQARAAIKDAQDRGRKDADTTLSKAEQSWKAREAERIAALETQWQEKSAKAVADARAQAKRDLDAALAQARDRWTAESDATLAKAEAAWKARETDRTAAIEAQLQQKSAKEVAEARALAKAARDQGEIELTRIRAELANVQVRLSERETALADARAAAERAREDGRTNLANAEKSWKAVEAARVAAAESRLRAQAGSELNESQTARTQAEVELRQLRERTALLETDLADRELELTQAIARINAVTTEIESLRENEDIEVRRVRGEAKALEEALAARDEELAQARLFTERSYERWQKQAEAEMAKAQKIWKSHEASKLAAARAEWQEESRKALEDSLAAERRAGRLPPSRPVEEMAVSADIVGSDENRPLPVFEPPAQAAPVVPTPPVKSQFAQARAAADEALDRLAMDAYQLMANPTLPDTHPLDTRIIKGGFVERRRNSPDNGGLVKSAVIAAILAAVAVAAFLFVWPVISQSIWPTDVQDDIAVPAAKPTAAAPKPVESPKAKVLSAVNVRSGPSTSDSIVTLLKAGAEVPFGEHRGHWLQVDLDAADGKPARKGWVYDTSLKIPAAPVQPAPAAPPAATPEPKVQAAPEPAATPPADAPKPEAAPAPKHADLSAPQAEPATTDLNAAYNPAAQKTPPDTTKDLNAAYKPPVTAPAPAPAATPEPAAAAPSQPTEPATAQ